MWQKINKIIKSSARQKMAKITQAAYICEVSAKVAKQYQFSVISYHNRALTINVINNVLAQELKFKESQIIENINKELKNDLIKKINYRIGG